MNKFKQLTAADRRVVETLLKRNCTQFEIASELGVNKSTVCREINRRSTPAGYFADTSQLDYEIRHKKVGRRKKLSHSKTQNYVMEKLMIGWSPEQISGRMRLEQRNDSVCTETIYAWIYNDTICQKDKMYQYLRFGKKKRTKHTGRSTKKSKIPNRVSIHQRPKIVEKKKEFGHWEGDSVIYAYKQAINTLNELSTGIVEFTKIESKTSDLTTQAMINKLSRYDSKTLTLDNGLEFAGHEKVSKAIGVSIYFCDPYSSWQRGSNENTNMLLRGYLPKKASIKDLTQEDLDDIAWELNNRPRKRLGYLTPIEHYRLNVLNLKEMEVRVAIRSRI